MKIRVKTLEEIIKNFEKGYASIGAVFEGFDEKEIAEWKVHCGKEYEVEKVKEEYGIRYVEVMGIGSFLGNEFDIIE